MKIMKKLLLFSFLFMAASYALAAFVPNPGVLYNIKQTNSGFVIGGLDASPCLQAVSQKAIQAFSFIPVDGMADTYYIKNEDGRYFSKGSNDSWDYWSVMFLSATNGTNSEWTIEGDESGFRLMCQNNSKYLASDNITSGSGIYCDKAVDNANGLWVLQEAIVVHEYFEIAEKDITLEIEKNYQSYPINISTGGISENLYVTSTKGFSLSKSTITPEDVQNGSGKLQIRISTTAAIGTEGKVYFWIGAGDEGVTFDSISVKSVDKQKRYYVVNATDTTLIIGNHSTVSGVPALTTNVGDSTQKFILRKVNPSVNDSLYYLIQDGDYRMIVKDENSNWNTSFGAPTDEAMWKIAPQENGITCSISNFVTGKSLGTDALAVDARLYDDKTFTASPTASPYCEWKIVDVDAAKVPELFTSSDNNTVLEVEKNYQSYPITVTTSGIKETINATVSSGFTVDKSAFTVDDVKNGSGKIKLRVSTTAAAGTNGTIVFSHGSVKIDTVSVTSVNKYARYYIENKSTAGLVIGFDSTGVYPALAKNTGDISQKFLLRPVNPSLNDSLYYIIQDGEYQMMKKSPSNAWDVLFGGPSDEAKWKINNQDGGAYSIITNFVSGKDLGADTTLVSSRLWEDKVFALNPISKPYCVWKLTSTGTSVEKVEPSVLYATVNGQQVNVCGTCSGDKVKVYNMYGQLVRQMTAESNITTFNAKAGVYLIKVNNQTLKVIK
jgi:hypothetical protein